MGYSLMSRNRVFYASLACAVLLFLVLVSWSDRWSLQDLPRLIPVARVDELQQEEDGSKFSPDLDSNWADEYTRRVQRVRDVCRRDVTATQRVSSRGTNRNGSKCGSVRCPIIVDERKGLFFCFIPKVASTLVKRFLLNKTDALAESEVSIRGHGLHSLANKVFTRVSPQYYSPSATHGFDKMMFVRHPFDRLVSAFRDKRDKKIFYKSYWKPIMKKLRPTVSPSDKITFSEFIWHVTHQTNLDRHWSPYWSRCDPCLVDYDFIGKLETAHQDFPYAFKRVGIDFSKEWWPSAKPTSRSLTLSYFSTVSEEDVRKLCEIFKLDFELFGYSWDEFLPRTAVVINQ